MCRDFVLIPLCLVMTLGNYAAAGHHGRCRAVCPRCETCCEFSAEKTMEEKSCWKIECEQICIPRVVFPWQTKKKAHHHARGHCDACTSGRGICSCVNNGARVKTIKKLKKHTYECPTCKYEWTPKKPYCGSGSGCRSSNCCSDGTGCAEPLISVEQADEAESQPAESQDPSAPPAPTADSIIRQTKGKKMQWRLPVAILSPL